ncbi:MAG TPA: hypothetical protein VGO45_00420 [Bacteroidia bacterium]|nr:hypothetical protein [Bacteroidia bacterium]
MIRSFSVFSKLTLFSLVLLSSCSVPLYVSMWQHAPVKADGNPWEWTKPLRYYDSGSKLQYTFSNDLKNMYICVRATNEESQQKILRGGMQIWIDTTGKAKERSGLLFPLPETETKEDVNRERRQDPGTSEFRTKKKFRNDRTELELTGFKPPASGILPLQNIYGVTANINMDSLDILTYEAIIPFRTFFKDSLLPADSSRVFSFKIVVNGLPHAKKDNGSQASSDMGATSGSMGGAGRRPGGSPRGGDRTPSNPMYESHSMKTNIRLRTVPTPLPKKWE